MLDVILGSTHSREHSKGSSPACPRIDDELPNHEDCLECGTESLSHEVHLACELRPTEQKDMIVPV